MNHILMQLKNTKYRIMLSKFRLSSHDLEIERGRYGHKQIRRNVIVNFVNQTVT